MYKADLAKEFINKFTVQLLSGYKGIVFNGVLIFEPYNVMVNKQTIKYTLMKQKGKLL